MQSRQLEKYEIEKNRKLTQLENVNDFFLFVSRYKVYPLTMWTEKSGIMRLHNAFSRDVPLFAEKMH